MKIYISGQISGQPYNEVRAKFENAAKKLAAKGYEPVNPINNGIPINAPWELHVAMDMVLLVGCQAIYLLPDWSRSKGATLEKNFAELTGKKMIYEEVPAFVDIKEAIAEALGVSFHDIVGRNRENKYVYARMIFAQLCRNEGATVISIAKEMQHNHATVIYYLKKYQDDYKFTTEFRDYVQAVQRRLSKD
mgnify:CR=1 FL=1